MSAAAVRILVVGNSSASTVATLQRLEREGWSSHCVNTIAEAEGALKMIRFDVVLAQENVGDDSGYHLTRRVSAQNGTLLVSVALSEASLWLPVVQRGMLTLGDRALNSSMLLLEVREALSAPSGERVVRRARGCIAARAAQASISAMDRRTGPEERRRRSGREDLYPRRFLDPGREAAATICVNEDASLRLEPARSGAVPRGGPPEKNLR